MIFSGKPTDPKEVCKLRNRKTSLFEAQADDDRSGVCDKSPLYKEGQDCLHSKEKRSENIICVIVCGSSKLEGPNSLRGSLL